MPCPAKEVVIYCARGVQADCMHLGASAGPLRGIRGKRPVQNYTEDGRRCTGQICSLCVRSTMAIYHTQTAELLRGLTDGCCYLVQSLVTWVL